MKLTQCNFFKTYDVTYLFDNEGDKIDFTLKIFANKTKGFKRIVFVSTWN